MAVVQERIQAALPKLVEDYLSAKPSLDVYYSVKPTFEALVAASNRVSDRNLNRALLVSVLKDQWQRSASRPQASLEAIESLMNPMTATITTGHQCCLYGGPLFMIYKILSVITLCEKLSATGNKVVPVFWMASEDHDFAEVNHFYIGNDRITWDSPAAGAVGRMPLSGVEGVQKELLAKFSNDHMAKALVQEINAIYRPDKTLAQATADLVTKLFGHLGLVVIDADDVQLKQCFLPVIQKELSEGFSAAALAHTNERLGALGYEAQIAGREINLFWLDHGYRQRIVRAADGFATADGALSWSAKEMHRLAEAHPEHFSPNVALRPLYQELILPNIAYVGGPGELSYWLQLKPIFDAVEHPFPAVLLRDRVLTVNEKCAKRKNQLGIAWSDLERDRETLFTELVRRNGTLESRVEEAAAEVSEILGKLRAELSHLDPGLARSAEAEAAKTRSRLDRLALKVLRQHKRQETETAARLDELMHWAYPLGKPQERVCNWLSFFREIAELTEQRAEVFDPTDPRLKVVQPLGDQPMTGH